MQLSLACFLLLASIAVSTSAFAQTFTLIHDSPTHAIIEIKFQDFNSSVIQMNGRSFVEMRAPGFEESGEPGGPIHLRAARLISIPASQAARIHVLSNKHQLITFKHPPKFFVQENTKCAPSTEATKQDQNLYEHVSNEPVLELGAPEFIGPVKAALLKFNPIQYEASHSKARITESLVVRIDYVKGSSERAPVSSKNFDNEDLSFYKSLFITKQGLPVAKAQSRRRYDLIIADVSLRNGVQEFVAMKEEQGRASVVKYVSRPTPDDIKAIIEEEYRLANPPDQTILIGDIDKIPAYRHNGFWSDYPFSQLDKGAYPDLSLGRIAAKTNQDLKNIIVKLAAREKLARQNENIAFISDGIDKKSIERLNDYKNRIFSNGQNSFEIKNISSTLHELTKTLAQQPNLIISDAKASDRDLLNTAFKSGQSSLSSNHSYPILFDLTCMASSWPSNGATVANSVEKAVFEPATGAAGAFASTFENNDYDLVRYILSAAIYDENAPDAPFHQINDLGHMIQFGKIRYLEQHSGNDSALNNNYMFLYHGDPASTFFSMRQ